METIKIKHVTTSDLEQLQQVGRKTFFETFAALNTEADMAVYLNENFSSEKILTEINSHGSEFYLAYLDKEVIGYLKVNSGTSQTELKDEEGFEIERIYVLQQYQGKKIGQILYDKALQLASERGAACIWLGVWEENLRAIRFYEKNGFVPFDKHIFKLGKDEQTDIMMKKVLEPSIDLQPTLEKESIALYPLQESDFTMLYAAAADPAIWAQHPNKDRWKKEIFQTFFDGAIQSRGAFRIIDKATGMVIGSTRFYDYDAKQNSIFVGYTFYATAYWGKGINPMVKSMMLDYIFGFVEKVYFHIGSENFRSQVALGRLGAKKIGEQQVTYFGEEPKLNFVYEINKASWHGIPSLSFRKQF